MSNITASGKTLVSAVSRHMAERAATHAGVPLEEWLDQAIVEHASDPDPGAPGHDRGLPSAQGLQGQDEDPVARAEPRPFASGRASARELQERLRAATTSGEPPTADAGSAAEEAEQGPEPAAPAGASDADVAGSVIRHSSAFDLTFAVSQIPSRWRGPDEDEARAGCEPTRSVDDPLFASLAPAAPPAPGVRGPAPAAGDERLLRSLDAIPEHLRKIISAPRESEAEAVELGRRVRSLASAADALGDEPAAPRVMDAVRRRMEEVRGILLAGARRGVPLERLDHEINELVQVIERLESGRTPELQGRAHRQTSQPIAWEDEAAASPILAPMHEFEAASQRLHAAAQRSQSAAERIQTSLDAIAAKPDEASEGALASLLRDLDAKLDAALIKDAPPPIEPTLAEIGGKLERILVREPERVAALGSIAAELKLLRAAVEAAQPAVLDGEGAERLVENLARRLEGRFAGEAADTAYLDQLARLAGRLEEAAAQLGEAAALQAAARDLLEKLQKESSKLAANADIAERLSAIGQERLAAERRIQALLHGIENALDKVVERLPHEAAQVPSATRLRDDATSAAPVESGYPAKLAEIDDGPPRRPAERLADPRPDEPLTQADEDEFLLEPGAAAPQRLFFADGLAESARPRTNAAISAHIAAARRAAQSAAPKNGYAPPAAKWGTVTGAARRAGRGLARYRRTILIAAVLVLAAAVAATVIRVHGPLVRKSEAVEQPAKATAAEPMSPVPSQAAPGGSDPSADDHPAPPPIAPKEGRAESPTAADATASSSPAVPGDEEPKSREATVNGSPPVQYELAQRLIEGSRTLQDQKAAASLFEQAASEGFAPAQFKLGVLYQKGLAVDRDLAAARRWYTAAAQAGNARAAHNLGVMLADATGGEPDYTGAAKWFRRAAEMGVRDSQFNLATLYARGLGVEQDLRQAWMWFSLAAAQGDAEAARKRDEVAGKIDKDSLRVAAFQLSLFKAVEPDPSANDIAPRFATPIEAADAAATAPPPEGRARPGP